MAKESTFRGEYIADELVKAERAVKEWDVAISTLEDSNGKRGDVRGAIELLKGKRTEAVQELTRLKNTRYTILPEPQYGIGAGVQG